MLFSSTLWYLEIPQTVVHCTGISLAEWAIHNRCAQHSTIHWYFHSSSTYCICIRRRRGIYGGIWPEPKGVPEGAARGNALSGRAILHRILPRDYFLSYAPCRGSVSWEIHFSKRAILEQLISNISLLEMI